MYCLQLVAELFNGSLQFVLPREECIYPNEEHGYALFTFSFVTKKHKAYANFVFILIAHRIL